MKILLIRPPFAVEKFYLSHYLCEPLGLEYLDAFLSKKHDIKIIDAVANGWNKFWKLKEFPELIFQGIKPKKIIKEIKSFKPDAIGITWLFSTQNESVNLITKEIRKYFPTIPIIVGGPHPSSNIREVLIENSDIDIVVYGEGELTAEELFDNSLKNLSEIKGIAFRKNGEIIINQPRGLIENLDILPMPKRDKKKYKNYSKQQFYFSILAKLKKIKFNEKFAYNITSVLSDLPQLYKIYYYLYNGRNDKHLPTADITTSRGCPYHCSFCAIHNIWGNRWRTRSAEKVLEEIDILSKEFGVKHLNILDDNFNALKDRTIKICQGIVNNNYNLTLFPSSGSYLPTLDEEVLTWLKKAGMNHVRLSIESGDAFVLHNIIQKNIDLDKVKDIVDICRKLKIYSEGCFMFGVPGETKESMQRSLDYALNVGFDRVIRFIFQPFPHTKLYDLCVEKKYLTDDYDPKKIYITGNICYVQTENFSYSDVLKIIER
jgi:magnesium-protoporphyrin IX monomethyl ester (oxidative) cyclase